jgi:fatty-acyl-CoA synthase
MSDGWFRTGDLGVMYPDGYIELRDRAKDVLFPAERTFPQSKSSRR